MKTKEREIANHDSAYQLTQHCGLSDPLEYFAAQLGNN